MTVSKLANKSIITSKSSTRTQKITKFTPHYMVAAWSGETCANYFKNTDRQVSANYCIGVNGDIVCNVPEERRAWTSSSSWNDQRAITVECGNLPGGQFTDATWNALVSLAVDICKRYGFRLNWTGNSSGSLTAHYMFASTDCPGPWMRTQMARFASEVNKRLDGYSPTPPKPKPVEVPKPGIDSSGEVTMPARQGDVVRLYNPYNGDHIITTNPSEVESAVKNGFVKEGVLGVAPKGFAPVYRFYNASNGQHLYTDDVSEAQNVLKQGKNLSDGTKTGWQYEGIAFIAYDGTQGKEKVYRLYNPKNGIHLLTTDTNEISELVKNGWSNEGIKYSLDAK